MSARFVTRLLYQKKLLLSAVVYVSLYSLTFLLFEQNLQRLPSNEVYSSPSPYSIK